MCSTRPFWLVSGLLPPVASHSCASDGAHVTAGRALELAMLSWLYALYCFDYR